MASWLLIRRALKEGDISENEAQKKRKGVTLQSPARSSHVNGFSDLPQGLRTLVDESYALQDRIVQLDRAMSLKVDEVAKSGEPMRTNPVGVQMDRLRVAFSR
jgi:regulator of CtrA degradation